MKKQADKKSSQLNNQLINIVQLPKQVLSPMNMDQVFNQIDRGEDGFKYLLKCMKKKQNYAQKGYFILHAIKDFNQSEQQRKSFLDFIYDQSIFTQDELNELQILSNTINPLKHPFQSSNSKKETKGFKKTSKKFQVGNPQATNNKKPKKDEKLKTEVKNSFLWKAEKQLKKSSENKKTEKQVKKSSENKASGISKLNLTEVIQQNKEELRLKTERDENMSKTTCFKKNKINMPSKQRVFSFQQEKKRENHYYTDWEEEQEIKNEKKNNVCINSSWFIEMINQYRKKEKKRQKIQKIIPLQLQRIKDLNNVQNLLVMVKLEQYLIGIYSTQGIKQGGPTGKGMICFINKKFKPGGNSYIDNFNYLDGNVLRFGNEDGKFVEFAHQNEFYMKSNENLSGFKKKTQVKDIYFYQIKFY